MSSITGDPHVFGADHDSFDFKGIHLGIYVLLSARFLSLAAQFEHAYFTSGYSKLRVHGSWMRRIYWTIRIANGRLHHTLLDARNPNLNGSAASRTIIVDGIFFAFKGRDANNHAKRATLTVTTPAWRTHAVVTKGAPHWGQLRINVKLQPLRDVEADSVAPHGILGQTYDGDGLPTHGRRDRYNVLDDGTSTGARRSAGGTVTTRAMGEGGIEGTADLYRIKQPFDTDFAFSRFGAIKATPRNAT